MSTPSKKATKKPAKTKAKAKAKERNRIFRVPEKYWGFFLAYLKLAESTSVAYEGEEKFLLWVERTFKRELKEQLAKAQAELKPIA